MGDVLYFIPGTNFTKFQWEMTHADDDGEIPTEVECTGQGLREGLTQLWIKTLDQGFLFDDEQGLEVTLGFSEFTLFWKSQRAVEWKESFSFWYLAKKYKESWAYLKRCYEDTNFGEFPVFKEVIHSFVSAQLEGLKDNGMEGFLDSTKMILNSVKSLNREQA